MKRKPHQPMLVFMWVLYPGQIGIWSVAFCGERKTLGLRKEPTTNSTQICTRLESNPVHDGGRLVLSSLHHPYSPWYLPCPESNFHWPYQHQSNERQLIYICTILKCICYLQAIISLKAKEVVCLGICTRLGQERPLVENVLSFCFFWNNAG